jgi:hypothetical protein
MGLTRDEVMEKKDRYNIMMRYITQRVGLMCKWIVRKFDVDEVMITSIESTRALNSTEGSGNAGFEPIDFYSRFNEKPCGIVIDGTNMFELEDAPKSLPDQIQDTEELLANTLKSMNDAESSSRAKNRQNKLKNQLKELKSKHRKDRVESSKLTKELKIRIKEDPKKFSEILSYYATTKHVSRDVRKVAQSYCKKYGINYEEWIKAKIKAEVVDKNEFTF